MDYFEFMYNLKNVERMQVDEADDNIQKQKQDPTTGPNDSLQPLTQRQQGMKAAMLMECVIIQM